jgi:hypothetical protein
MGVSAQGGDELGHLLLALDAAEGSLGVEHCRRSFESDQSCSLKVTTPGDSPFEIRWL